MKMNNCEQSGDRGFKAVLIPKDQGTLVLVTTGWGTLGGVSDHRPGYQKLFFGRNTQVTALAGTFL